MHGQGRSFYVEKKMYGVHEGVHDIRQKTGVQRVTHNEQQNIAGKRREGSHHTRVNVGKRAAAAEKRKGEEAITVIR